LINCPNWKWRWGYWSCRGCISWWWRNCSSGTIRWSREECIWIYTFTNNREK